MPKKVRVDKWLWSVRIFKTRTLANKVCKKGRVKLDGEAVKPAQKIKVGDILAVKKNGYNLEFKVLKLIQKRVGAPIAQECYEDLTPEEELMKYEDWYVGKGQAEKREPGSGRPTKKERRELEEFKRRLYK
jgi:ribosome-associated heat shock protein Hsp15